MTGPERAIFQMSARQKDGQMRAQNGLPGSDEQENDRSLLFPPPFSLPDQSWEADGEAAPGLPLLTLPSWRDSEPEEGKRQSDRQDRSASAHLSLLPAP